MSDEIQQAPEATTEQAVQLQLSDLVLATQVVQLASQRGAIKAEEMEAVGGLYNRLLTFLQASGALQPAQPATQEPAQEAPAAE